MSLASELLHTYSLIHDDLPAMDDDVLRRGKPTNHVVYGQAIAILAGDALQAEAFARLASSPFPGLTSERRMVLLSEFATAVGRLGMVGGQVMDMHQTGRQISHQLLRKLHSRKTGALIRFSVRLGGHLALAAEPVMAALDRYGDQLGLLFQVVDDLLDIEADSAILGKTAGKDREQQKATFPQLMGLTAAKEEADSLTRSAVDALTSLPHDCKLLVEMAHYVRGRGH
jgi:farnesyl diphosphate synthase